MRRPDRGVTLLFVLVILALASGIVVTMVTISETAVTRSQSYQQASAVQALLAGGEATAIIALRRDLATSPEIDHDREAWALVNQADVAIEGGRFALALRDAQGRFNLTNLASEGVLAQNRLRDIGAALKLDPAVAVKIILMFTAPGAPTGLDQLGDRAGFGTADLAALATMVTLLPGESAVNVNAAPVGLLAVLLNNPLQARLLETRRAKLGYVTPADVAALGIVLPAGLAFRSSYFRLQVIAEVGTTRLLQDSLIQRRVDDNGNAVALVIARFQHPENQLAAGFPLPPTSP